VIRRILMALSTLSGRAQEADGEGGLHVGSQLNDSAGSRATEQPSMSYSSNTFSATA
jgi:hypothetical protein